MSFELSVVLDSLDAIVYVADMDTHEILYVNKYTRAVFGDIVGELCWRSLQTGQTGQCNFCSNDKLLTHEGKPAGVYRWEFQNTKTKKWFDVRDRAIQWTDSRIVRLEIATDITNRKEIEKALLESEKKLKEKALELMESNTALKVLLRQREDDKKEFEENILSNIKHLVFPYIEKLKKKKDGDEGFDYLNILESNLNEIITPFASKMSSSYIGLTPKEIQIANLIKDGKQDKDIMEILNISLDTVKTHRQNIRKKLGIYGKRINLRTFLLSATK
jgi:DNA-binding CsgD family transcriptional regulator